MAERLVYAPKAWVYTKDANENIYDLTNYVTAGQVDRLVNQVSTASITLRNPQKIFTSPATGVAFHPQDPITIFLQRKAGKPVRVFTGYLDETPYYQMYPGTITLKASCTLKKLLYTFFDPALPYVTSFLEQYGWINKGDGTIVSSQAYSTGQDGNPTSSGLVPFSADGKTANLNDGSMGKLLWAVLFHIADWHTEKIYVEAIPEGVPKLMAALMKDFDKGQEVTQKEFEYFMKKIIGVSSQGTGGSNEGGTATPSGPVAGLDKIVPLVESTAKKYNIPAEMVLATMYVETNMSDKDEPSNPHFGWFQVQTAAPPYAYGPWSHTTPTVEQAHDLGLACDAFCQAAAGWANADPSLRTAPYLQWAMKVQGVNEGNNPRYPETWSGYIATAKKNISEFGGEGNQALNPGTTDLGITEEQRGATDKSGKGGTGEGLTHYQAIIAKCNEIDEKHYTYVYGGGHNPQYAPTGGGYDCSGSVSAVLHGAGYELGGPQVASFYETWGEPGPDPKGQVTIYAAKDGSHVFMKVGNRFWGTSDGHNGNPNQPGGQGPGWLPEAAGEGYLAGFTQIHPVGLEKPANVKITGSTSVPGEGGTEGGGGGAGPQNMMSEASATAFTNEISFPSVEEQVVAVALTGQKSLMNDKSVMPFVQQLAQASMRNFMSLPNGDFFAFYPDYFGEMGHRKPYWLIDDIEVLGGGINLTDDNLATHVFAVGDNTWPVNNELLNMLFSAGTISVFNAFESAGVLDRTSENVANNKNNPGFSSVMDKGEAVKFLQRYGARPLVLDFPMVRSPMFEMLMAYQQFMMAWSRQFITPFTFTFMPEIFPGGKVGFPDHGLQMYVESVQHSWDLESGFTTTAQLSAPSLLEGVTSVINPNLPPNMVSALVEPLRGETATTNEKGQQTKKPIVKSKSGLAPTSINPGTTFPGTNVPVSG
jgi:hypothetical protein